MNWELILSIATFLFGGSTITGFILYNKASRRMKDAEADKAQAEVDKAQAEADNTRWERYEKQLDHAASTIEILHKQIEADGKRIATLNEALDKKECEKAEKTARIRELTDRALLAEGLLNNANHRITKVTEERDHERLLKEKYKEWHCRSSVCTEGKPDPKGRRPPNTKILGQKFSLKDSEPDNKND